MCADKVVGVGGRPTQVHNRFGWPKGCSAFGGRAGSSSSSSSASTSSSSSCRDYAAEQVAVVVFGAASVVVCELRQVEHSLWRRDATRRRGRRLTAPPTQVGARRRQLAAANRLAPRRAEAAANSPCRRTYQLWPVWLPRAVTGAAAAAAAEKLVARQASGALPFGGSSFAF